MRPFADLLRAMQITGGIFLDADFTAPWCVASSIGPDDCARYVPTPRSVVAFHYVSEGRLLLGVDEEPPVSVERGEIVVLPRNDDHLLGSETGLAPVNAQSLIQEGTDGKLSHIDYGGGGELTRIVCGFLGTDRLHDPVLSVLPKVMTLKVEEGALGDWIGSSFRLAAREMSVGRVRTPDTLIRLAELLFIEAVQHYLAALPAEESQWCAAIGDPKLAHAIGLLHGRLQHRWTVDALAREIGMSRSSFAERFSQAMGASPMHYLAQLRLNTASRRLRDSSDTVARIAFDVGYESEAAFNRAFKREFGTPPAAWRKSQTNDHLPGE